LDLDVCGALRPIEGGTLFAAAGVTRVSSAEPDEATLRIEDTRLGASFAQAFTLDDLAGAVGGLALRHWLTVRLPTARESQTRDLIVAVNLASETRYNLVKRLVVGVRLDGEYDAYRYAEAAGVDGGMNREFVAGGGLRAEYSLPFAESVGVMTLAASGELVWQRLYASRESFTGSADTGSEWVRASGWGLCLAYSPMQYATIDLGVRFPGWSQTLATVDTSRLAVREHLELQASVLARF